MIKTLIAQFQGRAKEKRLNRYRLQLGLIGGQIHEVKQVPRLLCDFWRQAVIADLLVFTPKQRIGVEFELAHRNIGELVEFISEFNTLMAQEQDGALEQLCLNRFTSLAPQVLDHYFSDDQLKDVNAHDCLVTLQGALLSHVHMLEGFDNQYYQRQANRFYIDLYRLSVQLVQTVTQQEINPIKTKA